MFNLRSKETKIDKKYRGEKIYLTKIEDIDAEKLLAILFSMVEGYAKQEKRIPQKIVLSEKNLKRIVIHNKSLIDEKEDKKYILGVEIEVERKRGWRR